MLLVLLGAGVAVFWQQIKYRFVKAKISSAVSDQSGGLYRLSYDDLRIDEVGGNISVNNIHLTTDSLVYAQIKKDSARFPVKLDIYVPKLEVTGVSTPQALLSKQIKGRAVLIHSPRIDISLPPKDKTSDSGPAPDLPQIIYREVLAKIQNIQIDSLLLENIDLVLRNATNGRPKFTLGGFSADLTGILIDSAHLYDSSRVLFAENIHLHCGEFSLASADKQYDYHFRGMDYNSANDLFQVASIEMQPKLSEEAFALAFLYSKDRMHFQFTGLRIAHIDRMALFHQRLVAEDVQIAKSDLRIFRDISRPHDSVDRTDKFPQDALMALPLPMYVKTINMPSAYIEYKEKNAKSGKSGKVIFSRVHASLHNVTNIPARVKADNKMVLDFNSMFLDKAPFQTTITMLLGDPAGRFSLHATMGALSGPDLNVLIMPMGLARIDRGKINGLTYDLNADHKAAKGKLVFLYQDIKVALLKKDNSDDGFKTRFLPTLAAGLLVKDSNPSHGETRHADVDFQRDRYKSIFNVMWKSMFSGVKEIAGMKK